MIADAPVLPLAGRPDLAAEADRPILFPRGLLGFPECREFHLTATARPGFFWLRSLEHPALRFLLVDPFLYFDGYSVELADHDVGELAAGDSSEIAILATVTLPRTAADRCTANLQGPIAINARRRVARQLVLPDSTFGLRCPLDLAPADAA
ncbi:MAG TPA: flagellar assembly protein FliW [Longimicrobiales bacterium]|nr:flagellar assembly protein FliW [Longimicrobiales bacterium]